MLKHPLAVLFYLTLGILNGFSNNSTSDITIIIESLPANTPDNDTIFVCGNFNNWIINDPQYALQRRTDGKLSVKVPFTIDTLEYKFSRGNWMNIETGPENTYLPNRIITDRYQLTKLITIESWQDLGGRKSIPFYVFILSAGILNGLLLIVVLFRIEHCDSLKIKSFSLWILFLIMVFAGTILYENSNLIQKLQLLLIFQIGLTLAGPLILWVYNAFAQKNKKYSTAHFAPAIVVSAIAILRTLNLLPDKLFSLHVNLYLTLVDFLIILATSIIFIGYLSFIAIKTSKHIKGSQPLAREYWLKYFPEISTPISTQNENSTSFNLKDDRFFIFHLAALSFLTVSIGIVILVICAKAKTTIPDYFFNILFSIAPFQIFSSFYSAILNESVFSQPKTEQKNINTEYNDMALLFKIRQVMVELKPYKNPDLLLSDFSELVNSKPYIVSKVINDCFHHNFRDFINEFRIHEFISLINQNDKQNLTFLYLALEAGFNSKSTFNLAFKKSTGLSPREYFKSHSANIN
ncbi:helix-turn-helix domain-containing protein [Alkaliflexus imshenetskii]|uniref:helix-turn-helix domain-containing protein n=1 Tax=Alkaliflexus imshenetskii TaxID=286730 RepID=UPI0004B9F569|nr:helix-turn-helix domain-containing protein [Alkaliflexus imshenetskii]